MLYYDSMTLHSNVRTHGDKPVYVRLRDTIADAILAGKFGDGDPLPSVRAFAAEQGANPLTVAKAYQGFQDDGLIVVKRGVGMFVAPGARARLRETERETLHQAGMAADPRPHGAPRHRHRKPGQARDGLSQSLRLTAYSISAPAPAAASSPIASGTIALTK